MREVNSQLHIPPRTQPSRIFSSDPAGVEEDFLHPTLVWGQQRSNIPSPLTSVREAPSELRKTGSIEHCPLAMVWLPPSVGQSICENPQETLTRPGLLCPHRRREWGDLWTLT